jgi:outer membrane receptor protein involved in Fe transport
MKCTITTLLLFFCTIALLANTGSVQGKIMSEDNEPVIFANIFLHNSTDSTLAKVEVSDIKGFFTFQNIDQGSYFLVATSIGYEDLTISNIDIAPGKVIDLKSKTMLNSSVELETAVVTARRSIIEIKPDRTVFNVQGTINSAGANAIELLRKAPGVLVDNNDNISIMSSSGVLVYVDGKKLPLSGDNLTNYLQSLPAEQIDRIDIITNPGAKYEAEGNAGIIDIRLKKNENHGTNSSLSGNFSQGRFASGNINAVANYRNSKFNTFGTLGFNNGERYHEMFFLNYQNDLLLDEYQYNRSTYENWNYRIGTDFFLGNSSTLGFIVTGNYGDGGTNTTNTNYISTGLNTPVDSVLFAENISDRSNHQNTYNVNYVYRAGNTSLNIDADYGRYRNEFDYFQPNRYYNEDQTELFSQVITAYDTPVDIDIYSAKADFETELFGGTFGLGTKLSKVETNNTFLFYDIPNEERIQNDQRSNIFLYDEKVYAGYINFARPINEKLNFSAGLRLEQTDASGDLQAFVAELQEPPIHLEYIDYFPSLGLTYQYKPQHSFSLNYSRRINRPDYNVLNPFRVQQSELSFRKGNPFLQPEIVNKYELNYTLKYRYNFKLSYNKTDNQITRLIAPDDEDPRAGFITWANLAEQKIYAANIAAPIDITDKWNVFLNINGSFKDNQARYDDGGVVDVQSWSYGFYQQHTFKLPKAFTGEISGWFSGPGIWGGVFEYETSWSLNLGLQRKFFNDQMNVRLAINDIFDQSGWSGFSEFNGLYAEGMGNWDSRKVSMSVSMNFGNRKVKSRKHKTGIEDETGRVNSDG